VWLFSTQAVSRIDVAAEGARNATGMARSGQGDAHSDYPDLFALSSAPHLAERGLPFRSNQGDAMDTQNERLEAQADLLAEEALHELGEAPLDEPDEYAEQCDYAACYPWLADVICAHPHDSTILAALHGSEAAEDDTDAAY
jgi:hypothetical protein